MTRVSVDELSEHTTEIARRVREEGETIDLTDRGMVFARIAPVAPDLPKKSFEDTWEERDRLAREIGKHWPKGLSAVEAIVEDRR